jgi:hypothetical protein
VGVVIACGCVLLYVVQETVGLPGLPKTWWEPSRIASLTVETFFLILARSGAASTKSSDPAAL